VQKYLVML